ncbi:phosphoribosylanthranilate isomerase [Anaerolineae bacterium]|nr:phosphoribosylanthranilate isomerase [Anaerolineae bacterium]
MVKVKICGLMNVEDALAAVQAGADALGFVFTAGRHQVTPEQARAIIAVLPPFVNIVGVFVNEDAAVVNRVADFCRLDTLQFQGDESPEYCAGFARRVIKGFKVKDQAALARLKSYDVAAYLLDSYVPGQSGGTGRAFDWELVRGLAVSRPIILAGGLTPANVANAIAIVQPFAVDVSSGVENEAGRKDAQKMIEFVRQAKTRVANP